MLGLDHYQLLGGGGFTHPRPIRFLPLAGPCKTIG